MWISNRQKSPKNPGSAVSHRVAAIPTIVVSRLSYSYGIRNSPTDCNPFPKNVPLSRRRASSSIRPGEVDGKWPGGSLWRSLGSTVGGACSIKEAVDLREAGDIAGITVVEVDRSSEYRDRPTAADVAVANVGADRVVQVDHSLSL